MSDVLTRLILLLAGLLAGASSSAILAEPVGGQEPVPIEAGLAPTGLPYAPGPDVLHYYDFELALSEGDESFLGRARLRLALVEPLPEAIVLDLTGLAVDAVRIDGRDVEFELSSGQLRIARPTERTAGELTLDILYRGTPDDGLILRNFYADGTVFYLSLHQWPHYPGTGAASEKGVGEGTGWTLNVPLPAATSADDYSQRFSEALGQGLEICRPDFILISAGFDVMAGDPLGGMLLEPEDLHSLTQEVMAGAADGSGDDDSRRVGIVAALEGGYDPARTGPGGSRRLTGVGGDRPTPLTIAVVRMLPVGVLAKRL